MFGYLTTDRPHLYVKDDELYKALYCGLCKGIGKGCGQICRFTLSYDITFLSALAHNIKNIDVKATKQHCIAHPFSKKTMIVCDDLSVLLGYVNTLLTYYKLTDDIMDEKKGKLKRTLFSSGFRRTRNKHPQLFEIVEEQMKIQSETEKREEVSVDRAADPFAVMMRKIGDYVLGKEFTTEYTSELMYLLGKWVYLIDALDDVDKDVKKNNFNAFVKAYNVTSKRQLLKERQSDLNFIFSTLFSQMRYDLKNIKFYFNRDLTDNIILRGIVLTTQRLMNTSCEKEKKE